MDSPPPPYEASGDTFEIQNNPEYTPIPPPQHPTTHPSPPPYTRTANINTNLTGYELMLRTEDRRTWRGPIDTFEGADAIHIPIAVCRHLGVSPKHLGVKKFMFEIRDSEGQTVHQGWLNNINKGNVKCSDDGRVKVDARMARAVR